MKITSRLLVGALVAAALVLASCASAPARPAAPAPTPASAPVAIEDPFGALTDQAMALTAKHVVCAVGKGIDMSGRMDIAEKKARIDAQAQIAQLFELKVSNLQKSFQETLSGNTSDADKQELNEAFSSATKTVASQTLQGIQAMARTKFLKDPTNGSITAAVLLGIDPKLVSESLVNNIKTQPKLYERFRATEGYAELDKEAKALDDANNGTAAATPAPAPAAQ